MVRARLVVGQEKGIISALQIRTRSDQLIDLIGDHMGALTTQNGTQSAVTEI